MNLANLFWTSTRAKDLPSGSTIFEQGQPGDFMYVVLDGEIEIRYDDEVVDTASAGGIIGEMALIDSSPRSATAVAKSDCRLVPVDAKHFQFLVSETPDFALEVMRSLANRLRRTTNRVSG
jgi:CRP/FNR family transcriptional regulator, cyclic AMP receptor protein